MSAPELPPIYISRRISPVQQATPTLRFLVQRFSRYSESSLSEYPSNSPQSQGSLASRHSQHLSPASVAEELQTKYSARMKTRSADQTIKASEILEPIAANKNAMNISSTRATLNSERSSRLSSLEQLSSNNNDVKKVTRYSQSELQTGKIVPRLISRTRTSMKRNNSDNKLTENKKYHKNSLTNGKLSVEKTEALTGYRYNNGTINGMRRCASTFAISQENRNGIDSEERIKKCDIDDEFDNDSEKTQRIMDWIIGVDLAEPPPEQNIYYADEPLQTDTAVHIIYKGD